MSSSNPLTNPHPSSSTTSSTTTSAQPPPNSNPTLVSFITNAVASATSSSGNSSTTHRRSPSPELKSSSAHSGYMNGMSNGMSSSVNGESGNATAYYPDEKRMGMGMGKRGSTDLESGSHHGHGHGGGIQMDLGLDRTVKQDLSQSTTISISPSRSTTPGGTSIEGGGGDRRKSSSSLGIKGGSRKTVVSATVIVPIWIALSAGVIVFNKWLYSTAGFPYPVFLTSYHLGGAAVGTRLLRMFTPLMNGLDTIDMTREKYIKNILPIGVLFSGSLILSNMAYLTLSVSFIQMLKAFHPVAILLISAAFKIQSLTGRLIVIVLCISIGCCMAALGELEFEMFGFLCQASAVVFESSRLVMIQLLLQGLKMDPLCSLHYYAPICAIINACFVPFTEGWAPFIAFPKIGFFIMGLNALNAFLLNVAAVFLIGAAGGLVLTLAGVFKDILLITSSTLFFGSKISPLQIFGYVIALTGLVLFKTAGK